MTRSQWEVAHLALDPARIAPAAAGGDPVLEKLVQHAVMKGFPQLRGE
jgi:hypothetical protein